MGKVCGSKSSALCVIAFLDNEEKDYIKKKKEVLEKVRKSATLKVFDLNSSYAFLSQKKIGLQIIKRMGDQFIEESS